MAGSIAESLRAHGRSPTREARVAGLVRPGFEAVRQAFEENFDRRGELGAACAVYLRGERVVDLWGGVRDAATGEPWREDTMALVFSATKGMASLAIALAHSRGLIDFDERVSTYWPEFAQAGKGAITVRQLLAHQAGLFALDAWPTPRLVADPDALAAVLARQRPAWPAGARQAYHAITVGFYQGELLRRVDPARRTLGRFFQEELATPLGLDFYIRLPASIPDARLAPLFRSGRMPLRMLLTMPPALAIAGMNPRSRLRRALQGSELPERCERGVYARDLEIPAGGGVGTARAMARAYGVFAAGGKELGLREETLRQLMAPPVRPARGFRDACLKVEIAYALGFAKPTAGYPWGHPSAFGAPGAGGAFGFADPHSGIGFGYVPNGMGMHLDDPRAAALRRAAYGSIGVEDPYRG